MPSTKQIGIVQVRGDWSPLMSRLPGWQRLNGGWSDGSVLLKDDSDVFDVSLRDENPNFSIQPYALTHFALEVDSLGGAEEASWRETLQCGEVLRTNQVWDPINNAPMNAVHFYKPHELYVTLRENPVTTKTKLHHIGFEATTKQLVLDAGKLLKETGWENFWEGDLDGSYVLHFRAPDGLIHDVFCPEDTLKAEATTLDKKK